LRVPVSCNDGEKKKENEYRFAQRRNPLFVYLCRFSKKREKGESGFYVAKGDCEEQTPIPPFVNQLYKERGERGEGREEKKMCEKT